jgi:hypothetical protein
MGTNGLEVPLMKPRRQMGTIFLSLSSMTYDRYPILDM